MGQGATAADTVAITAGDTPPHGDDRRSRRRRSTWRVGDTIAFSGSASDPDETLGAGALTWTLSAAPLLELALPRPRAPGARGRRVGSVHSPRTTSYPSYLELVLTAKDSHGGTATDSVELHPATVQLTFATSPPGLRLVVDGEEVAPFTRRLIVGSTDHGDRTVAAGGFRDDVLVLDLVERRRAQPRARGAREPGDLHGHRSPPRRTRRRPRCLRRAHPRSPRLPSLRLPSAASSRRC